MRYAFILTFVLAAVPAVLLAQGGGTEIRTFQAIPGLQSGGELTTQQYVNALYVIAIAGAAVLAVIKLIIAGVRYMLDEVVTSKQKAKDDIKGALLGLLIILGAVTILNTINPNLTQLNILRNATPTEVIRGGGGGGGGGGNNVSTIDPSNNCPIGQTPVCNMVGGQQQCTGECY